MGQRGKENLSFFKDLPDLLILCSYKDFCFLAGRNIHACADIPDTSYCFLDDLHSFLFFGKVPLFFKYRPGGDHNGFFLRMKGTVDFFCDERHIWVKQLQSISKNLLQRPQSRTFGTVCIAVKSWFHHLDVPVAEFFPDEIIYLL